MSAPNDFEMLRQMIASENATATKPLHDKVDHLTRLITGHDNPSDGVIVRLDRLEQTEQSRKFWLTTAVSSGLLGGIASAWHWLRSVG